MPQPDNVSFNPEDLPSQVSTDDTKNTVEEKKNKPVERVGILLVHGIGRQKQFEHLREVTLKIVKSLRSNVSANLSYRVETILRTSSDGAFLATEKTWLTKPSPVTLRITDSLGKIIEIDINEVWWADLADNSGLKFWWWALTLWASKGYFENRIVHSEKYMFPPEKPKRSTKEITFWERVILFGISLIALYIIPLPAVLSRLLGAVGFRPPINIISQYMNQVRIFSQNRRDSNNQLIDSEHPPRVSIRRRMINAMVRMALNKYDRWYILAHSQGTVLAFNGIMESEQVLPNYLDEATWQEVIQAGFHKDRTQINDANEAKGFMRPTRPTFLDSTDLIDRRKIFEKLNGLLTYGSPLDKFAIIWPAIVRINRDRTVFNSLFQWINVYDPTDPVASKASFFDPESGSIAKPINIPYKSSFIHLISHITYLDNSTARRRLIDDITKWLLGSKFPENPEWKIVNINTEVLYSVLQFFIWLNVGLLECLFIGWLPFILGGENFIINRISTSVFTLFSNSDVNIVNHWWYQAIENPMSHVGSYSLISTLIILLMGVVIVFTMGILRSIQDYGQRFDSNFIQEDIIDLLQQGNGGFCLFKITDKLYEYDSKAVQKVLEKMVLNKILRKENIVSCPESKALCSKYSYYFYPVTKFRFSSSEVEKVYENLDFEMKNEIQIQISKLRYDPELVWEESDEIYHIKIPRSERDLYQNIENDLNNNQDIFSLVMSKFVILHLVELGRIPGLDKDIAESVVILAIIEK